MSRHISSSFRIWAKATVVGGDSFAWHVAGGRPHQGKTSLWSRCPPTKAVVEIPSPVSGRVLSINPGAPGDTPSPSAPSWRPSIPQWLGAPQPSAPAAGKLPARLRPRRARPYPSQLANHRKARPGGGPGFGPPGHPGAGHRRRASISATVAGFRLGRGASTPGDLQNCSGPTAARPPTGGAAPAAEGGPPRTPGVQEIPIIGIRRVIAQRMSEARAQHPAFFLRRGKWDISALHAMARASQLRRRQGFPCRSATCHLSWPRWCGRLKRYPAMQTPTTMCRHGRRWCEHCRGCTSA